MTSNRVEARELQQGDVVQIDGQPGWWEIDSFFIKASDGSIDMDLHNVEDNFRWNWEVSLDALVLRAT